MSRIKQELLPVLAIVVAATTFSLMPSTSYAQAEAVPAVPQPAPAMHLKDLPGIPGVPKLTVTNAAGQSAHIFPTVPLAAAINRAKAAAGLQGTGPLVYHAGGKVMTGTIQIYTIFWLPAKLQSGGATSMSANYQAVQSNLARSYGGHPISANNTQYYQFIGRTTYISGLAAFGGSHVDTSPYPSRLCTDSLTPSNCLTDAQIRAKIAAVMALKGWTGGINKIFLLYTSSGMGSCFDTTNKSCAYTNYCAYHSYFTVNSQPVIYGNEPYGNTAHCQNVGAPSPHNDPIADAAATAASHEVTEAITDPFLNAWYSNDAAGDEIGDLCAYNYGTNTWDSGKANQMWSGYYFELQTEYSNHKAGCVQLGP